MSGDPDRLARFLVDGLGFVADGGHRFPQGEVRRFRRDDARCKVFSPTAGAPAAEGGEGWPTHAGFAYAALLVPDADAALAQAVQAGATVMAELVAHRPGARMAMVRDPEGNVWELLEEGADAAPSA
ncbi:MAG: VOC family protein [Actinomycetota bacterium]